MGRETDLQYSGDFLKLCFIHRSYLDLKICIWHEVLSTQLHINTDTKKGIKKKAYLQHQQRLNLLLFVNLHTSVQILLLQASTVTNWMSVFKLWAGLHYFLTDCFFHNVTATLQIKINQNILGIFTIYPLRYFQLLEIPGENINYNAIIMSCESGQWVA